MGKKKILIVVAIIILIIIIGIGIFLYLNRNYLDNIWYNIRMIGVKEDIVISHVKKTSPHTPVEATGYANSYYYHIVDLSKKEILEIEDYYIFGQKEKKGSHYSVEHTKKLDDDTINHLLEIIERNEDKTEEEKKERENKNTFNEVNEIVDYYRVKYKEKIIYAEGEDAKFFGQLTYYSY